MSRLLTLAAPLGRLFRDAFSSYVVLMRLMVPALIIVKALDMLGGTAILAGILAPIMGMVGLPAEIGIVWAAAMLTSLYTGLAVFADVSNDLPLTVAQVSVLGTMILVAHSLPVEGAVAKATGVPWPATLVIRIGGAFTIGALLNVFYTTTGTLQAPAVMLWRPEATDPSLFAWAVSQLRSLALIFVIIFALMALLQILRAVGIERLMHAMLAPLLRFIGIGEQAADLRPFAAAPFIEALFGA